MAENTETAIVTTSTDALPAPLNLFSLDMFREAWKVAEQLAKSRLIPQNFQNNPPDCIIAMEMAQRIGASIFSVMQSLYIVHGRPGWSAQFIIAALNSCGRFSPLRFDMVGEGDARTCTAWALEKGSGEKLTGPPVSIDMSKKEGWYNKNGSKWQTMPELMLRYRAATFFGRLYAPDILMGMRTAEELHDIDDVIDVIPEKTVIEDLNRRFAGKEVIDTSTGEVMQHDTPQQPETTQLDDASNAAIKVLIREINKKQSSLEIDQWRAKYHKRVASQFGGEQSDGFVQVMDYANAKYNDMYEAEQQQGAN